MKKLGFTLSEVLLTLSIIGVVSAMTVPSLVTSIEERELQAQAKKAYNTLQSAVSMKYALTRQTPADVQGTDLIESFLASDVAPTLKYVEKKGNTVKLPDGQLMAAYSSTFWCGGESGTSSACYIRVDLNGEDGPTFSAVENKTGALGTQLVAFVYVPPYESNYDRKTRDIVFFKIQNLTVTPHITHGNTKRYFSGQQ